MDHNPYTPPQAKTETSISREPGPRPVAVWLLMVLLIIFALMFIVATVRLIRETSDYWSSVDDAVPAMISLLWHFALVSSFSAAAYGAFRRHRWSRWFGVALLAVLAATILFGADTTEYKNDAERAGGRVGRLLLPALFVWWAYALTLSKKAKRYFSKDDPDGE